MARCCEVCENLQEAQAAASAVRLSRFLLEGRVLALCAEHAQRFRTERPATLEQARALFCEKPGDRSLLGRRAPFDRRQFPLRPEGRRRGAARRAGEPELG